MSFYSRATLLLITGAYGWNFPLSNTLVARYSPHAFSSQPIWSTSRVGGQRNGFHIRAVPAGAEKISGENVMNRKFSEVGYAKGGFLLRTWKTALQHDLALGVLPADTHPGWFDDLERRNKCNVQFEMMEQHALKLAVLEKANPDNREGGAWEAIAPEIRHARLFVTMSVGSGSTIALVSAPPDQSAPWDILGLGSAPMERDLGIVGAAETALVAHIVEAAGIAGRTCRIQSTVLDTLISSDEDLNLVETDAGSPDFRLVASK